MILRAATADDTAALAQLGAHSFTEKFGHLYRAENLAGHLAEAHSPAKVAKEIMDPGMRVMLAEEGGRLLGYCKLVMACGWPEHAQGRRAIELKQLYTHPEAIGQGIGGQLMAWALEEARAVGADEIQLSVYSDNPGAQRFYARYGFSKAADIHFIVGDQRDEEFLFSKRL